MKPFSTFSLENFWQDATPFLVTKRFPSPSTNVRTVIVNTTIFYPDSLVWHGGAACVADAVAHSNNTDPSVTGTATATDNCDSDPVITFGDSVAAGRKGGSDGLVPYESSHISGAASELILRSGHSVQHTPLAARETRRILLEHLKQFDAATR